MVSISSNSSRNIAINFTVPATAASGITRMRVTMRCGSAPSPCGAYSRGETEDYSVVIGTTLAGTNSLQATVNIAFEKETIEIFPNPASDILYLKGVRKFASNHHIEVYDLAGKKVLVNTVTGNKVNVSSLKTGTYFIRVLQNGSIIYSGSFIKQ